MNAKTKLTRQQALQTAKPILFNTEMVRAILDGRKTVTRRLIKHPYYIDKEDFCRKSGLAMHVGINATHGMPYPDNPYDIGDILYVRETWSVDNHNWLYRADFSDTDLEKLKNIMRWGPSIHMPKKIARIFLRVTDVHVERLQDCGNMQAKDEGCTCCSQFARIWDKTIKKSDLGKYGWDANPWVVVVSFERLEVT